MLKWLHVMWLDLRTKELKQKEDSWDFSLPSSPHLTSCHTKQIHLSSSRLSPRASGPRTDRAVCHLGHTTHWLKVTSLSELNRGEGGERHRGKSGPWWSPVSAPCPCPSLSSPQSSAGRRAGLWFWASGSWWDIVSEERAAGLLMGLQLQLHSLITANQSWRVQPVLSGAHSQSEATRIRSFPKLTEPILMLTSPLLLKLGGRFSL